MKRALAVSIIFLAARCATIANGRYQSVNVTSDPAGADVRVACGDVNPNGGRTPTTVKLRRNARSCAITISQNGFVDRVVAFERKNSGWFWANLLFPGLVAELGVELATGPPLISFGETSRDHQVNGVGLVAGAGLGMWIDHATGGQYVLVPRVVNVTLEPRR